MQLCLSFHASRFGPGTGDGDDEADGARCGVVGVFGICSAADRMKSSRGKAPSVARDLENDLNVIIKIIII